MPIVPEPSVQAAAALPGEQVPRDDLVTWAAAASLIVHALILIAASMWPSIPSPAPEIDISVELLSPEQYEAEIRGSEARVRPEIPAEVPTDEGADDMIHPSRMLSAAALAGPKSAQAREMLPTFEPTERDIQLCNIEAMEQVHAWQPAFRPERIVAYAMAELAIAGDMIRADGAAFFSGGKWYAMRFDCGLSADHASIVSFGFRVEQPIPRAVWEAHNLPVGDDLD